MTHFGLIYNSYWYNAANDHAAYCKIKGELTHFQESLSKKTPEKRVLYYKGNFFGVGENIAYTYIDLPIYEESTKKNIIIKTYEDLAESLFLQWKNSPKHYENMISPIYKYNSIAIAINENKFYAVVNFGSEFYKPISFFNSFKDTNYGIKEQYIKNCFKGNEERIDVAKRLSYYISNENPVLYLYYEHEKRIKEIISQPKDGIALDIVLKKQFSCTEDNNLKPSFYNGVLLNPSYRDSIFMNDEIASFDIKSKLAILPTEFLKLPESKYQINTIILKNNEPCMYSIPAEVDADMLPIIKIDPFWVIDTIKNLPTESISMVKTFQFPFERNSTEIENTIQERLKTLLKITDGSIEKIEIEANSSVEGNPTLNKQLYLNRAIEIEKFIRKNIQQNPVIEKTYKINWSLFYEQIKEYKIEHLFNNLNKKEIEEYINQIKSEDFNSMLEAQRVATIKFHIKKNINNSLKLEQLPIAVDYYNYQKNSDNSNIAFSRLINAFKNDKININYLAAVTIPKVKENITFTSNYLAAILLQNNQNNQSLFFDYNQFKFLFEILNDSFENTPLNFNKAALNTFLFYNGIKDSVVEFKKIEKDIVRLSKDTSIIPCRLSKKLLFNYYLTGSKFYTIHKLFEARDYCYYNVKNLIQYDNLSRDEIISLVKYFNFFGDFKQSIVLLEESIKKIPNDPILTELYISTGAIYNLNNNYNIPFYLEQIEILNKLNHKKLCEWLNINFQVLRTDEVKRKICRFCVLD